MSEGFKVSPDTVANHLPIWTALSELFATNDLSDNEAERIAGIVLGSGLDIETVNRILWEEIWPAFAFLIKPMAEGRVAYSELNIKAQVVAVMENPAMAPRGYGMLVVQGNIPALEQKWVKVRGYLPPDYTAALDEWIRGRGEV